ncbi:MAG: prepilin-type N-terminal cleavage/methylation domain-containing protein [Myxococcales bacterium]|nr:prepilin-type N-terminal cleavage/methylation domain-containing protein [Myxococcales bacterium]
MKTNSRQQGFTLLELMISLALGMILIAAAYGIYISQHRGLEKIEKFSAGAQSARLTIEQVTRELRMAGFGVVKGETFTEAKKYALTFRGDVDADIAGTLAATATAGDTSIRVDLNDSRDTIDRGDYLFINGGGNVEFVPVVATGDIVNLDGEPDTVNLGAALANSYPADSTLVRTIETVQFAVSFPSGVLQRNHVLQADGLKDMEFHYFKEGGVEMEPDAVNGLSQLERAAIRQIEIRLRTGGQGDPEHNYSQVVELRNMGNRPFKADTCAPNPPTNVTVSDRGTCGHFTLTWSPPTANACDGSALTDLSGYKISYGAASGDYYSPSYNVSDEILTSMQVEDIRLQSGSTYYLKMQSYDASFNESSATTEISFNLQDTTPPNAPTEVDATAGVGSVALTWTPSTSVDVKGYRVYRAESASVPLTADHRIADENTLSEAATGFIDTTAQSCLTYYYAVTAVDCANEGPGSAEAHGDGDGDAEDAPTAHQTNTTAIESPATPPAVPTPFQAIGRDRAVDFIWTNPADRDFAGVLVRYSTINYPANINDGEELDAFGGTAGAVMRQTQSNLINGTRYYYSAFAYDRCGNYAERVTASAIPSQNSPVIQITAPASGLTVTTGQMGFSAKAYDPDQSGISMPPSFDTDNGKGIYSVNFYVTPSPGTLQLPRYEYIKEYCGFGGDSDPCPAGDVTQWCDGIYSLYAVATDDEGAQTASPYISVAIRNGGLYVDSTVTAAVSGTYNNEVTFGIENNSSSSLTITKMTLTWDKPLARLATVQIPDGTTVWENTSTPAASGEEVTFSLFGQPSVSANTKKTVRVKFVQMQTTLSQSASAGATVIQVASTSGFAAGETIYLTSGSTVAAASILSVGSGQLTLTSGLTTAFGYGSTVSHRQNATDVQMSGADLRATFEYQKVIFIGRVCLSDQAAINLSRAPEITNAQQDKPTENTAMSTVPSQIHVDNYRTVPVHVGVTDNGASGISSVKAYYYVDHSYLTVAPETGYTNVAMSYSATNTRWEVTLPYQSSTRVWVYYLATDNNSQTDRDPTSGAYVYDYVTDTTPPACPLGLVATMIAKKQIDLSWIASTDGDIAGYNIYRNKDCGSYSKVYTLVQDSNPNVTGVQYSDTSSSLDTSKYCHGYYICAVDLQGNVSASCQSYTASAGDCPCP